MSQAGSKHQARAGSPDPSGGYLHVSRRLFHRSDRNKQPPFERLVDVESVYPDEADTSGIHPTQYTYLTRPGGHAPINTVIHRFRKS